MRRRIAQERVPTIVLVLGALGFRDRKKADVLPLIYEFVLLV